MPTAKPPQSQEDATPAPSADDELIARLDEGFPPSWQPTTPGETVAGVFLRVEEGITEFGPSPLAVIQTADGELSIWFFTEAMKNAFKRAKPAAGERIAVRYEGEQEVKNPTPGRKKTAKIFRVAVDRPKVQSGPIDWDAVLGDTPTRGDTPPQGQDDEIPF